MWVNSYAPVDMGDLTELFCSCGYEYRIVIIWPGLPLDLAWHATATSATVTNTKRIECYRHKT